MDNERKVVILSEAFKGREDVFAREVLNQLTEGKSRSAFIPVCRNRRSKLCRPVRKGKLGCMKCNMQQFEPITYSIWRDHISGRSPILQYLLFPDGTVLYFVVDFDDKEKWPEHAYKWKDVSLFSGILNQFGIAHLVFRSSGRGHHLVVFLEKPLPASKAISLVNYFYRLAGFMAQMQSGVRPLPEVFPRQAFAAYLGNGIRLPMNERRWEDERCGLVYENGSFVLPDQQWHMLANRPIVSNNIIEKIILDAGLVVEEAPTHKADQVGSILNFGQLADEGFEAVLSNCAALASIARKGIAGQAVGHFEGFALLSHLIPFANGRSIFNRLVPNWDLSNADSRQIEHFLDKGYSPYSCSKMQELGVCKYRDPQACLDARWYENRLRYPSPTRFAHQAIRALNEVKNESR